jgi:DNA-binding LacI/PurR family transcriptional regulator
MQSDQVETVTSEGTRFSAGVLHTNRVERILRQEIDKLQGVEGAMLPRQEELVEKYGVSIRSVRDAIERLKGENLIRSIRGKGMFVVEGATKLRDVLLICDEAYFPFQIVCMGVITSLLKERDYTANLVMSHDPARDWSKILQKRSNACGAVLISRYSRQTVSQLVRESEIPIVTISDLDEPVRSPAVCDAVLPDDEALGYRAVEYLAKQGHRKIALLGWELSKASGYEILQGYRNALTAFGLEFNPIHVMDLPVVPADDKNPNPISATLVDEVRRHFDWWVQQDDLPTALIHLSASESAIRDMLEHCMNNHFKPEAIVACLYKEQLHAGYGGLGEATAMCINIERIAQQALELLFRPRKENSPPIRHTVEEIYLYRRKAGSWQEEPTA